MRSQQEILEKLAEFLKTHNINSQVKLSEHDKLAGYGLTALEATKGVLQDIYAYQAPQGAGLKRKLKNKVITVVRNIAISTMELAMIRQNKFNELTFLFIQYLLNENDELRAELQKLKNKK